MGYLTLSLIEKNVLCFRSNRSIVEDILKGEGKTYGAELLKDLLKLLPDVEEVCVYSVSVAFSKLYQRPKLMTKDIE